MKKLISVLILVALMLPAMAYNETELSLFADGVVAATDPDADWTVTNGMIAVIRPATQYEIENMNDAYYSAKELSIAANTIALHFPGEFNESAGGLRVGSVPYLAVVITYPLPG